MSDLSAIGIAEGFIDCNDDMKFIEAWQHLIDTGLAWSLQGWFGRTAMAMIEDGVCHESR